MSESQDTSEPAVPPKGGAEATDGSSCGSGAGNGNTGKPGEANGNDNGNGNDPIWQAPVIAPRALTLLTRLLGAVVEFVMSVGSR